MQTRCIYKYNIIMEPVYVWYINGRCRHTITQQRLFYKHNNMHDNILWSIIKRATALISNRQIVGHRIRVVLTFARDIFTGWTCYQIRYTDKHNIILYVCFIPYSLIILSLILVIYFPWTIILLLSNKVFITLRDNKISKNEF